MLKPPIPAIMYMRLNCKKKPTKLIGINISKLKKIGKKIPSTRVGWSPGMNRRLTNMISIAKLASETINNLLIFNLRF